jgi:hypothetical protein
MTDSMSKNFIDYEQYPQTANIQNRCINMIADLLHAPTAESPDDQDSIGTSTVGSSEGIMLAMLAMKKRWQNRRKAEGKDSTRPNIVMNSAVQVCWEKAARYFDVEEKYVYCTETRYVIDPEEAVNLVDENTIGICAILGTTYTGQYEDVKAINDLLIKKKIDCPIHVDAASGGFVAPFVNPSLEWDFRLPKVVSINVSGHKYGLVSTIPMFQTSLTELGLPRRRLGLLALSRIPPQRTHLQRQLPRHRTSNLHPQLLQGRLQHHRTVLPAHPARPPRLPLRHAEPNPHRRPSRHRAPETQLHHHERRRRRRPPARRVPAPT